jgi:hypothetical protein
MSEKLLESEQAQSIAANYICQKENIPSNFVRIESFEPYSWSGMPVFLFHGKITKQTIDITNPDKWQAGISETHPFSIWITANEGKIIGFRLGEWEKSKEQQSDVSGNQIDRELKKSEIERNRAETERYNAEMQRMADEDFESQMRAQDTFGNGSIDPNRHTL